jgi:hypothetical protein
MSDSYGLEIGTSQLDLKAILTLPSDRIKLRGGFQRGFQRHVQRDRFTRRVHVPGGSRNGMQEGITSDK